MQIRIQILLLIKVMEICDHWHRPSTPQLKASTALRIHILTLMRIRIQLFFLKRIRLLKMKQMKADPDPQH
jgi:hypothetical protein